MTYQHESLKQQGAVLCADIGGTNFRLAAVQVKDGRFSILRKETHSTPEIKEPAAFFAQIRSQWEQELKLTFVGMGLALAGPVIGQTCTMTNAQLSVDGASIEKKLGIPVWLMNDLAGITYGVALIDHKDSAGLYHLGGPSAGPHSNIVRKTVVAPGTGLGVGHLVIKNDVTAVLDTESGHIDFAPHGEEAVEFQQFMKSRFRDNPGYEQFTSGRGFEHLFEFYVDRRSNAESAAIAEIENSHGGHRGALISKYAETDEHCRFMMELFVDMMARFSSTVALTALPRNGLYLAGGIPGKNISWFQKDNRFIKGFQQNYLESIANVLKGIPVYLVDDGDLGLYGAAHACLLECTF